MTNSTGESGYQSIDRSTQQHDDNRNVNQNKPLRHNKLCLRLGCTIVLTIILVILLLVFIGCTTYFHNKDAACYGVIPQVSVFTRSDAYSVLYSTSALTCLEKPIGIEVALHNEAASVEIYETLCESIEKRPFGKRWSNTVNVSVSQPSPVFSEDFSSQNYFINGSIQIDMVDITTSSPSVGIELCLFMNNDDFQAFLNAGTNWKKFIKNAECFLAQVKTGDNNSTTFLISEPTFAFMGIAAIGRNVSIRNLTVTTNGFELSSSGENSTEVCQLNGKHPTCNFNLINHERKEFCLVAHEEERSDGSYDYSNLTIRFTTKTNVGFWVSLSMLLLHIAVCITTLLCTVLINVIYKKWNEYKCQSITPTEETPSMNTPTINTHTSADQPTTSQTLTERGTEIPSVETRAPIPETDQQSTPVENSVHGTQTSIEQIHAAYVESRDQITTTDPTCNWNLTAQKEERSSEELRMPSHEGQREPTLDRYSELDTKSTENDSSYMFPESVSEKNREDPGEYYLSHDKTMHA